MHFGFRCPGAWDALLGDDRERYCDACDQTVCNLDAMAPDEAVKAASKGGCFHASAARTAMVALALGMASPAQAGEEEAWVGGIDDISEQGPTRDSPHLSLLGAQGSLPRRAHRLIREALKAPGVRSAADPEALGTISLDVSLTGGVWSASAPEDAFALSPNVQLARALERALRAAAPVEGSGALRLRVRVH